ncbi:beta-N-acetylhexosaminidase [Aureimonas altamirensis]|uniref:beta-N-acetylhexosaminidase n=1 Tax=Aureimonas altamirensis TaxID=370622 RepID=UPI0025525851|nr:beta-N-acetylhexosaminidase [Aureimonas altamirensis]
MLRDTLTRMDRKAWISGCSGTELTPDERAFFADERPWGFILFGRNVESAGQLTALCASLQAFGDGPDLPIFIDQEGGRVRRLKPPMAHALPAGQALGRVYEKDRQAGIAAARAHGRLLAADLRRYGINADCIPCLDLAFDGAHGVIGDRALSADPDAVSALGRAMAEGALSLGVLPVMKHLPGHGRVQVDSHYDLPHVDADRAALEAGDMRPFKALADLPAAMTAHILYESIDRMRPATLSPTVIGEAIRGTIGFDGLLMTDDISMKALRAPIAESSAQAIEAGCDIVLHCNGDMAEMRAVAGAVPVLSGQAARRAARAMALVGQPAAADADVAEVWSEYQGLVEAVA